MCIMRLSLVPVIVALAVSTAASQEPLPTNAALIARAKSFELDTPYVPPPGDALEQWPPNTVGRYHNTDPVLINYLIRLGVEKRGEEYLSFPHRALFDKLGIRTMVIETDPFGNFLGQGYELASGRDWARLGNLYLQDGVWNDERILPEGYAKFVSTLAPAWEADKRPIYGGFFWINGDRRFPVPRDAYYMAGAGGQTTLIIPSHDLVVVRLGHFKGAIPGAASFTLALLMQAVPKRN